MRLTNAFSGKMVALLASAGVLLQVGGCLSQEQLNSLTQVILSNQLGNLAYFLANNALWSLT
jgi:hypothetical protein